MKTIKLTIITENQNKIEKAEALIMVVQKLIDNAIEFAIDKYSKSDNSYKINFVFRLDNSQNYITESIEKTSRLCSPWMVDFDKKSNEIELIFNKSEQAKYQEDRLNVIKWAHWIVEDY